MLHFNVLIHFPSEKNRTVWHFNKTGFSQQLALWLNKNKTKQTKNPFDSGRTGLWWCHFCELWTFVYLWITTNCGKFLKQWEYQTTWLASWEICMQVKKQHLKLDMEQQTGSKLGKKYVKAVYCHPAYLTYMQSISWEILGWMKHKRESRLPGEISTTSDMQMTPPLWQKARGTKEPPDESERGEWKSWLKTQHSKK